MTIRGNAWQAQLRNCQKSELAHLYNCMYTSGLSHKQQASSRPHFRAVRKVNWKMIKNCIRNRSTPDEIDTKNEICTSLKPEFYFRFRWSPSTKSTLISCTWVRVFVTIRGKICAPRWRNWKSAFCTPLLPVCLRNSRHLADHISEPYAEFYGKKRWRIAYVIILDWMKSIPKPKFAPL